MSRIGFEGQHCQTDKRMYCSGLNIVAKYCIMATMCKGFPSTNFGPLESDYCIDGLGYGYFHLLLKSVSTHSGGHWGSSDLISALLRGHPVATPLADFYVC